MEIYLLGTRMFMIMEVNEHFSFEKKAEGRSKAIQSRGVGKADVEVPAGVSTSQAWEKWLADGENFQTRKLTRQTDVKRYCDELSAIAEFGRLCAVDGLKYIEN